MNTKFSRRTALAGGFGLAMAGFMADVAAAAEAAPEKCWKYVKLDPAKVAQAAYDAFGANGCMYGAVKGAISVFAETTTCPNDKAAAQNFPFFAFRYGRAGCAKLKEICGALNGAILFMSCFVDDYAEIPALAKKLADWAAETELPTFVPADDKYPDFLKVKAGGITCAVMGKAWMSAATDEQKKIVGERCKRHTASIMAKAVEILNEFYEA